MQAVLLLDERRILGEDRFAELTIWRVPAALHGSRHCYKYRLALVINEVCVLRYDNEAGKGDHRHIEAREAPYRFTTIDQLVDDFLADIANM